MTSNHPRPRASTSDDQTRGVPAATRRQCDTTDMVLVHRVFRREIGLLSAMVDATAPGDLAQSRRVARHAREMLDALHHHHAGEDDVLWPRLRDRAPEQQNLIDTMDGQHRRIGDTLTRAEELMGTWLADPTFGLGAALSAAFRQAHAALVEHLDDEERRLLPLVELTITGPEWDQFRVRGMAAHSKRRLPVFLAHMLEEATPRQAATFLARVPLPGRILHRLFGISLHRREIRRLRPTTTSSTR